MAGDCQSATVIFIANLFVNLLTFDTVNSILFFRSARKRRGAKSYREMSVNELCRRPYTVERDTLLFNGAITLKVISSSNMQLHFSVHVCVLPVAEDRSIVVDLILLFQW